MVQNTFLIEKIIIITCVLYEICINEGVFHIYACYLVSEA
jgi:hypothetical protein